MLLALATAAPAEDAADATPEPAAATTRQLDWDQARVATLARELANATVGIRQALRNEPAAHIVSGESRARMRLADLLRRLVRESAYLAEQLEAGKGHDETVPVFENLLLIVRDARVQARRIFLQGQTLQRIGVARAALEQLDPFYDQRMPLPPPGRGRG